MYRLSKTPKCIEHSQADYRLEHTSNKVTFSLQIKLKPKKESNEKKQNEMDELKKIFASLNLSKSQYAFIQISLAMRERPLALTRTHILTLASSL